VRLLARLQACTACLTLAGCLLTPPAILQEGPAPRRATLLGTLWPPPDEPTFVIGDRAIVIEGAGEPVGETQTDRRGKFEVRLEKTGVYALSFSADGHGATTKQSITNVYATYRVDLVAHRL
jgi:hypothetical protein